MADILTIIETALERKGLTASAASRLAVGNPSLIKNMRLQKAHSKRFNSHALQKLAAVLDLEFYFGEARELTLIAAPPPVSAPQDTVQTDDGSGFVRIPYHPASTDDGPYAVPNAFPIALSRDWLVGLGAQVEAVSLLPVLDDTMAPSLAVGALVVIDGSRRLLDQGGLWAFVIKGRYLFRRVQCPQPDMIVLNSDKPDQPVQVFKGDQTQELTVLGQVIWVAHQP